MDMGFIQEVDTRTGLKIDPRTKLLLMIIVNITIFGCHNIYIMFVMAAIPISLLFLSRKIKGGVYCAIIFIVAALLNTYLVPITHGIINIFLVMISGMLYRMMPGFIMGYYMVTTTTVSEFIASMEAMNITEKIIIPLSVIFRFFPTIVEEAVAIGDAMGMRGVGIFSGGLKKPLSLLEYWIVPLLMSTVKIGDELSAASLTRGLGNPTKRTNVCSIGFGIGDIVLSLIGVCAFAGFLFMKKGAL